MSPDADDTELITRCRRGDSAAYGELVRRYQDRLYNTVYRLVGHEEDARDAVQDAFLSAYQSLRKFKGDSRFFTWLYRIAVNAAITRKRKDRLNNRVDSAHNFDAPEPSVEDEPGRGLERADDERVLQTALNRMTPEFRVALVLKEIDGLKYEEIAEVVGVPIGTVRSRIHRGRLELTELLRDRIEAGE